MAKSTSTPDKTPSPIAANTVITLTIPWKQAEPVYNRILKKTANKVKLPGFRAGKVPSALAEESIGVEKLIDATLEEVLPPIYQGALVQAKKQPLTAPQIKPIKFAKGQDWEVEAHFAEAPTVKLGDYQKVVKTAHKAANDQIKKAPIPDPAQPLTDQDKKDILSQGVFSALIKAVGPAVPELLIRHEVRHDLEHLVRTLDQIKVSLDEYLKRRQLNFDQLSGELAATALARLQLEFILSAIATQEKISATETEIKAQLEKITDERVRAQQLANPEYVQYIQSVITRQKTMDFLLKP